MLEFFILLPLLFILMGIILLLEPIIFFGILVVLGWWFLSKPISKKDLEEGESNIKFIKHIVGEEGNNSQEFYNVKNDNHFTLTKDDVKWLSRYYRSEEYFEFLKEKKKEHEG